MFSGQPQGPTPPLDYSLTKRTANVHSKELPSQQMLIRFPIQLLSGPNFTSSDFTTFGFDRDYDMAGGFVIRAEDYVPFYTSTDIRVVVDLL